MYKFVRVDEDGEKTIFTTDNDTWPNILNRFLLFLKGSGFYITASKLEENISYFDSSGSLMPDTAEEESSLSFEDKLKIEQYNYDHVYKNLKKIEIDSINLEDLDNLRRIAKENNVSLDAVVSTVLKEYIDS